MDKRLIISQEILDLVDNNQAYAAFCQVGICHDVPAKTQIITAGEVSDKIYLLTEGTLQVYITDDNGKELILTYLNGLNFFGEFGILRQESIRSANVKARTECQYYEMTYEEFNALNVSYPILMRHLAEQLALRLKNTSRHINSIVFEDVHVRVLKIIANMAAMPDSMSHPKGLQIRATRQEIAQIVGSSRETVGRVIKVLEDAGIIETKGKIIILLNEYTTRRDQLIKQLGIV